MMATVDMNLVQIYRPPLSPLFRKQKQSASSHTNGRSVRAVTSLSQAALPRNKLGQILESSSQFKPEIVATLNKRHDIESQVERRNDAVKAQDVASSNHNSTNGCDESDDDLPSLEELSQSTWPPNASTKASKTECPLQHPNKPALDATSILIDYIEPRLSSHQGDNRGSQDLLVIIEDNELDSINAEDEAEAASDDVDAIRALRDASPSSTLLNQDPAFELGKPIDLSAPERWYDVEAGCYINEELPLGLEPEQEGMTTSASAQDHPPSPCHDNGRNTQRTLEEPAPCSLPELLVEDYRGGSYNNVSEMERDLLLAFEESSATTPSFPQPPCLYTKPSHPQIDQEHGQSRTSHSRSEELGYRSPPRNQDQDEGEPQVQQQQQQQQQEVAAEAMREEEKGDDHNEEREQRGEKRRLQGEAEESSAIHHSKSSSDSYNTSSGDDEDPRPAKRRKLCSAPAHKGLTPQPQNLTPPSAAQLEVDDRQSQADRGSPSTPVDDTQHHSLQTSQSPSARTVSLPLAEYQEWPFQGFLKRTKIGNETTYNLEFQLPRIPEHLRIPIPSEALGIGFDKETSAEAATPHNTVVHSKIRQAPLRLQKLVRWTPEEDATILEMKEEGCSWEDIQDALPNRTLGAIQVHYSTKLKGNINESDPDPSSDDDRCSSEDEQVGSSTRKQSLCSARFKAELRAQHKQKGEKGRGRLPPPKAGKQAAAGVSATGQTQEKKRRGRPRKQV